MFMASQLCLKRGGGNTLDAKYVVDFGDTKTSLGNHHKEPIDQNTMTDRPFDQDTSGSDGSNE